MSIFIMPEGTKASDVVMLLRACHRQIDALTAQRDELAALLRAALPMLLEIAPKAQRELLISDIRDALAKLTPTAPTNGEGDAK